MSDTAKDGDTANAPSLTSEPAVFSVLNTAAGSEEFSDETEDYSSMTAAELKALAREKGISGYGSMTKAALTEALSELSGSV